MARINVDFSEVEEFDNIPKGDYPVVIEKVEIRDSQTSQHQYLNWTLVVSEGEYKDRKLWLVTSFSPKALFRMKQVFDNLAIFGEGEEVDIDFDDESGLVTSPELAGLPAIAVVKIEKDRQSNTDRNRVDTLLSIDAPSAGQKVAGGGSPAPKKTTGAAAKPPASGRGKRTFT